MWAEDTAWREGRFSVLELWSLTMIAEFIFSINEFPCLRRHVWTFHLLCNQPRQLVLGSFNLSMQLGSLAMECCILKTLIALVWPPSH